ncbi:unnamed protein product, partial [Polarella glacialis]
QLLVQQIHTADVTWMPGSPHHRSGRRSSKLSALCSLVNRRIAVLLATAATATVAAALGTVGGRQPVLQRLACVVRLGNSSSDEELQTFSSAARTWGAHCHWFIGLAPSAASAAAAGRR